MRRSCGLGFQRGSSRASLLGAIAFALTALGFVSLPAPLAAQRTDVVILRNGDHITGEVEELARGRLRFNTDDVGRIFVEWEQAGSVTSDRFFEVELEDGERLFGSLAPGTEEGELQVTQDAASRTVEMMRVVGINPIGGSFWSRLDGFIELAFTFAKANKATTYTFRGDTDYRAQNGITGLSFESYLQSQESADATTRNNIALEHERLLPKRWSLIGYTQVEQNEQLDLEIRGSLGAGGGRMWLQTNTLNLGTWAGLLANRERFSEADATTNLEFLAVMRFEWFTFTGNETDLSSNLTILPNLTDWGRVRLNFDTRFERDLFLDFYLSLNGRYQLDTRPAAIEGEDPNKSDFSFDIALGWDF
jgi:hypothetical protein